MDYQSRYAMILGDMVDEDTLLEWQKDEDFSAWFFAKLNKQPAKSYAEKQL